MDGAPTFVAGEETKSKSRSFGFAQDDRVLVAHDDSVVFKLKAES
jgi:hypothetical protein